MTIDKPYPDEVCSNTDKLDLPSWCVETPDFTAEVLGQLCFEFVFLFGLFAIIRWRYKLWQEKKQRIREEWPPRLQLSIRPPNQEH